MPDSINNDNYAITAEFYDYIIPYRDRSDVAFYIEAAKASKGPVLEIGCGTGRLLIPIAREKIQITGIDLSKEMLARCLEKLTNEPNPVTTMVKILEADMRNFRINTQFGLTILPFRSFQHLVTIEDQCLCLQTIYKHLHKNGQIILDLFNPSIDFLATVTLNQELGPEPEFTMPDGRKVTRWYKFTRKDYFNQINYMEFIYYIKELDGSTKRLVHSFPMRYLFRYEAEHLLYRCGFKVLEVFRDYEKNPYGTEYPGDLIILAEKI